MIHQAATSGSSLLANLIGTAPAGIAPHPGEAKAAGADVFASTLIGSLPATAKDQLSVEAVKPDAVTAKPKLRPTTDLSAATEATPAKIPASGSVAEAAPKSPGLPSSATLQSTAVPGAPATAPAAGTVSTLPVPEPAAAPQAIAVPTGPVASQTKQIAVSITTESVAVPVLASAGTSAIQALANSSVAISPVPQSSLSGQSAPSPSVAGAAQPVRIASAGLPSTTFRQVDQPIVLSPHTDSTAAGTPPTVPVATLPATNPQLTTPAAQPEVAVLAPSFSQSPALFAAAGPVTSVLASSSNSVKTLHGTAPVKLWIEPKAVAAQPTLAAASSASATPSSPIAANVPAPVLTASELAAPVLPPALPGVTAFAPPLADSGSLATAPIPASASTPARETSVATAVAVQTSKKEGSTRTLAAASASNTIAQPDASPALTGLANTTANVHTTAPVGATLRVTAPVATSVNTSPTTASSQRSVAAPAPLGAPARFSGTASPIFSSVDETTASPADTNVPASVLTTQIMTAQLAQNAAQPQKPSSDRPTAAPITATASVSGSAHAIPVVAVAATHPTSASPAQPATDTAATPAQHAAAVPAPVGQGAGLTATPTVHAGSIVVPQSGAATSLINPGNATTAITSGISQTASPAAAFAAPSSHQTLVATPNVLEVGVSNGTEGWLRIRAELQPQSGEVTASVVANSVAAVDSLHKQLPAMSAYLAGEQVNVASLVVERSSSAAAPAHDAASAGGGNLLGQSSQQNPGNPQDEGVPASSAESAQAGSLSDTWSTGQTTGVASAINDLPVAAFAASNGSWLNVRA